jgi:endo-1,4-beta-xylanase
MSLHAQTAPPPVGANFPAEPGTPNATPPPFPVNPIMPPVDEARLLAETDARILQARTGPLTIQVVEEGKPAANRKVQVEHRRHLFFFGAGFDMQLLPRENESEVDKRHREHFLNLFNAATIHLYWGSYERHRGEHRHEERLRAIRWLKEHELTPRGHPIFWNQDNIVPRWILDPAPGPAELRRHFDERLEQLSRTVLPELRDVDVFNELVQWERFKNNPLSRLLAEEGKVEVVTHYLKETRRLNSSVQTVVNDYDNSPAFYDLLRRLIEADAPIDIIGQQSHMHGGVWSPAQQWTVLNRLSLLERPVLFTELSVLSGPRRQMDWKTYAKDWHTDADNEQHQADYLEQFYRLAFSHTNCIGVVVWDYADRRAWLGAPVGLLRPDGSPKPAYKRLDALINRQWRTRGEYVTNSRGEVVIQNAFEGEYLVKHGETAATGVHRAGAPLRLVVKGVVEGGAKP